MAMQDGAHERMEREARLAETIAHLKSDNKDCAKETKEHNVLIKKLRKDTGSKR